MDQIPADAFMPMPTWVGILLIILIVANVIGMLFLLLG